MSRFDSLEPTPKTTLLQPSKIFPSDFCATPDEIIAALAKDGEPVPTGIPWLDARLRRGGLTQGRVICFGGPPFAGKTNIVVDIALALSMHIPVYALFTDEGWTFASVRLGVMLGMSIEEIEDHPVESAIKMRELLAERSIYLLKPDSDFANAEDVFDFVATKTPKGENAGVVLDSIQTIPARRDMDGFSEREAIKEFMRISRLRAAADRRIVISTSQANRASYRSKNDDDNLQSIAAFSGSSSIEFLFDLGIALSLPDEAEIVKAVVVKNRLDHFKRSLKLPKKFHLRFSDSSGRMAEVDDSEMQAANQEAMSAKLRPTCDAIRDALRGVPERSGAEIERRLKGGGKGFGSSSIRAAIEVLENRGIITSLYRDGKGGGYFYALKEG